MVRTVLLIEDNADLAHLLPVHLQDLDCAVEVARDGRTGLEKARAARHDLIVLDLLLPGLGGIEICQRLRRERNHTPILILSSRSSELDRVLGLNAGADDYVTKPFSMRELRARVQAILRRQESYAPTIQAQPRTLTSGALSIDLDGRRVELAGDAIELTAKEFDLLAHFARHPGRVFTRAELLDSVWGYHHEGYEHTVNSHINRLRAKIERDPRKPSVILTVWGVGYKFADIPLE